MKPIPALGGKSGTKLEATAAAYFHKSVTENCEKAGARVSLSSLLQQADLSAHRPTSALPLLKHSPLQARTRASIAAGEQSQWGHECDYLVGFSDERATLPPFVTIPRGADEPNQIGTSNCLVAALSAAAVGNLRLASWQPSLESVPATSLGKIVPRSNPAAILCNGFDIACIPNEEEVVIAHSESLGLPLEGFSLGDFSGFDQATKSVTKEQCPPHSPSNSKSPKQFKRSESEFTPLFSLDAPGADKGKSAPLEHEGSATRTKKERDSCVPASCPGSCTVDPSSSFGSSFTTVSAPSILEGGTGGLGDDLLHSECEDVSTDLDDEDHLLDGE